MDTTTSPLSCVRTHLTNLSLPSVSIFPSIGTFSSSSSSSWTVHPATGLTSSNNKPSYQRKKAKLNDRMNRRMKAQEEEEEALMALTVKELREKLKEKGMPVSGVKVCMDGCIYGWIRDVSKRAIHYDTDMCVCSIYPSMLVLYYHRLIWSIVYLAGIHHLNKLLLNEDAI